MKKAIITAVEPENRLQTSIKIVVSLFLLVAYIGSQIGWWHANWN